MRNAALTALCLALLLTACQSAAGRPSLPAPATMAPASLAPEQIKASSWPVPDRKLTPGGLQPGCVPLHRPQFDRHNRFSVTRYQVFAHYGWRVELGDEADHDIPFEWCGSNGLDNVWPELADDRTRSVCTSATCVLNHKDELETALYDLAKVGQMDQARVVKIFRGDWRAAWCHYVRSPGVDCGRWK